MDYKDVIIDNDAIVVTEPQELPAEAHNIPQGVKPELNPNPGYGEDGKTVPAIKIDLVEGEHSQPKEVDVTALLSSAKPIPEVYNFLKGLLVKGKPLEDYIDSQGGVTEAELQSALSSFRATLKDGLNVADLPTIENLANPTQEELAACFGRAFKNGEYVFIPSYYPECFI